MSTPRVRKAALVGKGRGISRMTPCAKRRHDPASLMKCHCPAGAAVDAAPRIDGPAPSPSVTVEAGEVVVRLPWDCPAERIVAVASGLRLAR